MTSTFWCFRTSSQLERSPILLLEESLQRLLVWLTWWESSTEKESATSEEAAKNLLLELLSLEDWRELENLLRKMLLRRDPDSPSLNRTLFWAGTQRSRICQVSYLLYFELKLNHRSHLSTLLRQRHSKNVDSFSNPLELSPINFRLSASPQSFSQNIHRPCPAPIFFLSFYSLKSLLILFRKTKLVQVLIVSSSSVLFAIAHCTFLSLSSK